MGEAEIAFVSFFPLHLPHEFRKFSVQRHIIIFEQGVRLE